MENTFRTNLRSELEYQGVTVKELSAKTGIPKPILECYVDKRATTPPADRVVRIAAALGVTVEFLVAGRQKYLHEDGKCDKSLWRWDDK
ncbi:MAG: helix-turn-helix domain-containing protein [Treponema sp.]|nr:helix-turn-helix domain-containing protein [Treponema sp.]